MVSPCPCVPHDRRECVTNWCIALVIVGVILGILVGIPLALICGNVIVHRVSVSIEDATLSTFALATPSATSTPTAAVATYNLSMTVRVYNPNGHRDVHFATPLEAQYRFDGALFGPRVWLAREHETLSAGHAKVFRLTTSAVDETVPGLGVNGVAEFARQSSAGVFEVDVVVAGRYTMREAMHSLAVTCELKLPLGAQPARSSWEVKCV